MENNGNHAAVVERALLQRELTSIQSQPLDDWIELVCVCLRALRQKNSEGGGVG